MTTWLSDSVGPVFPRVIMATLLVSVSATALATELPSPPTPERPLERSLVFSPTRASEAEPEQGAIKLRVNGEYEARQSFLTPLPLAPLDGSASLGQSSRLFHWLRLRGLALFGTDAELRAEADLPRGMIYGQEPEGVPDSGTDFDRRQLLRVAPRALRLTLRNRLGELSLGHTTTQLGMGLVDADGDQPRWFGTPDRAPTYERLELQSGDARSALRVGASGDVLFDDGRLSLLDGDQLLRFGLTARFAPSTRSHTQLLARYEVLRARDIDRGAAWFLADLSGGFRNPIRGHDAELFGEYEGAYRFGTVNEVNAFATGADQTLAQFALAARAGVALTRVDNYRRFARAVASLEWGFASGDADPTDSELRRFTMSGNHGVGSILFGEMLRFKTARAQALLSRSGSRAGQARLQGLSSGGGVAGATYVNPVLLFRPDPDVTLKAGLVVASATTKLVDPSAIAASGERRNFDGGASAGRSLGTELDLGAELLVPLQPPMQVRLSVEGAVAFPGSAFADENGHALGMQALTTCGLGLTF